MGWIKNILSGRRLRGVGEGCISAVSKSDPGLKDYLYETTRNFFSGADDGLKRAVIGLDQVGLDGDPGYISEMLKRVEPHDGDYIIFRAFSDPKAIILDIGANWGYSVGSLRSVGVTGSIISFEAIPIYGDCLQRIKELDKGPYHFLLTALSSRPGVLKFTVPVVGGVALTALTSASPRPHLEGLSNNIFNHVIKWMPNVDLVDLKFCQFEVPVDTLDSVIAARKDIFSTCAVDAVKIDVEGLEFEVLKGAEEVLRSGRPLVMAEGGNRREGLQGYMESLGYGYFERSGDKIHPVSGVGAASNGFFAHESKIDRYESSGILSR